MLKNRIALLIQCAIMGMIIFSIAQARSPEANSGSGHAMSWTDYEWGRMGIAKLQNAPFPDPAREKGFQRNGKSYPYAGHYDDSSVAFVVPKGFEPGEKNDIVVIFHGHLTTVSEFIVDYGIGKAFGASGRNAILMVPQGPRNAPDSGGGKMEREGGFERLVKEALAALKENKIAGAGAEIGNLSVCAYSGGFRPLAHALHFGGMKDKIREVWLVDAAYDFQDYLAAPWAAPDSTVALRAVFTDHLAPEHMKIMSNISRRGHKISVYNDDELTTQGTTPAEWAMQPFRSEGAKPGEEELPLVLRNSRICFVHTQLPHDGGKLTRRFLEAFLRESPVLKPIRCP